MNGDDPRGDRSEFNPDPRNAGTILVEMKLVDEFGNIGVLKTRVPTMRIWGPNWRNLTDEVFLATRGQLKRETL